VSDVAVTKPGRRFSFLKKSPQLIRAVMAGQHLQRDQPVQLDLAGEINHAHAAAAQFAFDLVTAEDFQGVL